MLAGSMPPLRRTPSLGLLSGDAAMSRGRASLLGPDFGGLRSTWLVSFLGTISVEELVRLVRPCLELPLLLKGADPDHERLRRCEGERAAMRSSGDGSV